MASSENVLRRLCEGQEQSAYTRDVSAVSTCLRCNNHSLCLICRDMSSLSLLATEVIILSNKSDEQHKWQGSAYPTLKGTGKVKGFGLVIDR